MAHWLIISEHHIQEHHRDGHAGSLALMLALRAIQYPGQGAVSLEPRDLGDGVSIQLAMTPGGIPVVSIKIGRCQIDLGVVYNQGGGWMPALEEATQIIEAATADEARDRERDVLPLNVQAEYRRTLSAALLGTLGVVDATATGDINHWLDAARKAAGQARPQRHCLLAMMPFAEDGETAPLAS